jgi:hypothetical protein
MPIRHSIAARLIAGISLLVLCVAGAQAFPVTWTLSGVTFNDGGTASGSFVYDADTNTISTLSISVAGGDTQTFPPLTYDNSTSTAGYALNAPTDAGAIFDLNASIRQIRLPAVSQLTDAGGTLAVNITGSGAAECFNCGPFRVYTAGNLIGTAAPSITSAATASYLLHAVVNVTVTTTGAPLPTLSVTGALPSGVTFTDNGDGTGTFAGSATSTGTFPLVITASNGVAPDATQDFTLTIRALAVIAPTPTLGDFGMLICALLLFAGAWRSLSRRAALRA